MTTYIIEKLYDGSVTSCLPEEIWKKEIIDVTGFGQQWAQYIDRNSDAHYDSEVFWNQKQKEAEEILISTEKSEQIENVLIGLAGISRNEAKKKGVCTWCKQPITDFKDAASRNEYRISGFCQKCQDEVFG
jgi:hypothetical protein